MTNYKIKQRETKKGNGKQGCSQAGQMIQMQDTRTLRDPDTKRGVLEANKKPNFFVFLFHFISNLKKNSILSQTLSRI